MEKQDVGGETGKIQMKPLVEVSVIAKFVPWF